MAAAAARRSISPSPRRRGPKRRREGGASGGSGASEAEDDEEVLRAVRLGAFELRPWFFSPYPEPVCRAAAADKLLVCDRCFAFACSSSTFARHLAKCTMRAPPGQCVYADKDGYRLFQVDGQANREYCRNLCLFCKLFLDQKTLYYDVDAFFFYVLTVNGVVVGYFSKEKTMRPNRMPNNLSCILTFPQYHSRGYGKFLISASYALSRQEGRVGSPEKPLSGFGLLTYRSYWRTVLLDEILRRANLLQPEASVSSAARRAGVANEMTASVGLGQDDALPRKRRCTRERRLAGSSPRPLGDHEDLDHGEVEAADSESGLSSGGASRHGEPYRLVRTRGRAASERHRARRERHANDRECDGELSGADELSSTDYIGELDDDCPQQVLLALREELAVDAGEKELASSSERKALRASLCKPQWFSIKSLSKALCIHPTDIIDTLRENRLLFRHEGHTILYVRREVLRKHLASRRRFKRCDDDLLADLSE